MNRRLQACLVSMMVGAISGGVFAQSGANVPLQRGVSVQLAFVAAAVHAQAKIDLNGTWVFAVETDQGSGTATVTLKVEGEKVTGHISAPTFESDFTGTLKGQALEFSFSRDVGAVTYKGTAESSDAIKGTVDIAGVTGTFTAKRKPA